MSWIARPLAALAALGFLCSLAVHAAAWMGLALDSRAFVLHGGVFVVWFPAVLLAMRIGRNARPAPTGGWMANWNSGGMQWSHMLSGCPRWMRIGLYVVFAYAIGNFLLMIGTAREAGGPGEPPSPATLRGFSGHWMVFYYAAFALAWSVLMKPELLLTPTCVKGHRVMVGDRFCAECGSAVKGSNPG